MSEKVIEISSLKKSFNGKYVLRGVSFHLNKKENIVILGKSGEGKSILLKSLVGLIHPEEGHINVLGEDILKMRESKLIRFRRKIGYLFQEAALYDSMTVGENITFALKRLSPQLKKKELLKITLHALEQVSLNDVIDKMPDELSGGMKKRVALARTLVLEPEIILYDEPTTGLDPQTSREISRLILEMRDRLNISALIVTHDMTCAEMTSDRLLILNEGKIAAEGKFSELKNSEHMWIRRFFDEE
ncbi:MAG: ABC transporter ATP-binding protein [Cytophagaceae bacterium]